MKSKAFFLAALLVFPAAPSAHHSFAAEWDADNCRDFVGTLTKIDWQNPHPYFFVDVKDASGQGRELVVPGLFAGDAAAKRHGPSGVSRQRRQGSAGARMSGEERQAERRGRGHAQFADGVLRQVGQIQD